MIRTRLVPFSLCLSLLLTGCIFFDDGAVPPPREAYGTRCSFGQCDARLRGPIDPMGAHVQYVVDTLTFADPERFTPADLDCDGRADHQLDALLVAVYQDVFVTDLEAITQATVDDGRILHLIDVQTTDTFDAIDVGLQMFVGHDDDGDPTDNFTGAEMFSVDDRAPTAPLAGYIEEGQIFADLGTIPMQIALPGVDDTFVLELSAGYFEGTITADSLIGTVSGSLTTDEVENGFLPIVHATMVAVIEDECAAGCPPGSRGELLLDAFDSDNDQVLTLEEVRDNQLIDLLLVPDIDLFDSDGYVNPDCDGVRDSLSFAVGVTAVPAQF